MVKMLDLVMQKARGTTSFFVEDVFRQRLLRPSSWRELWHLLLLIGFLLQTAMSVVVVVVVLLLTTQSRVVVLVSGLID
jgi:hypothetical protein